MDPVSERSGGKKPDNKPNNNKPNNDDDNDLSHIKTEEDAIEHFKLEIGKAMMMKRILDYSFESQFDEEKMKEDLELYGDKDLPY